jgi:thiol-disulfide isomerase/thioredoxin
MAYQKVLVEVLTASGCGRCQKIKTLAKAVITELNDNRVSYREINVVEEIDYAVSLGVMSTQRLRWMASWSLSHHRPRQNCAKRSWVASESL